MSATRTGWGQWTFVKFNPWTGKDFIGQVARAMCGQGRSGQARPTTAE